jgi:hypothetical protein
VDEFERYWRTAFECRCAFTADQREKCEVQFVYQIMYQQIIPEQTAQEYENISAWSLFERGNFRICISTILHIILIASDRFAG